MAVEFVIDGPISQGEVIVDASHVDQRRFASEHFFEIAANCFGLANANLQLGVVADPRDSSRPTA
ncbi:MAG: hypothetical protein QM775_17290 [Pirellulales bacterium]